MSCPDCEGDAIQELERATALGYRLDRCRPCRRTFTSTTCRSPPTAPCSWSSGGSAYSGACATWPSCSSRADSRSHLRLCGNGRSAAPRCSWRDCGPSGAAERGAGGIAWHCDETYVKAGGRWCDLDRAIATDGNLVDSLLSETRDRGAPSASSRGPARCWATRRRR